MKAARIQPFSVSCHDDRAWTKLRAARCAPSASRTRGNVAITFALATLPIVGFVGAAVDYSHANSVKAAMQAALDATALMLSKEAATDTSDAAADQGAEIFHRAVHPAGSDQRLGHADLHHDRRLPGRRQRSATCRPASWASSAIDNITVDALVHRQMGHLAAARRAGARQHRLDGRRRQDDRAEDRDQESADPVPERRRHNGDVYVSIIPFIKDVNVGAATTIELDRLDRLATQPTNSGCRQQVGIQRQRQPAWPLRQLQSCIGYTLRAPAPARVPARFGQRPKAAARSRGHLQHFGLQLARAAARRRHLLESAETTQSSCTSIKACSRSQYTTKTTCQNNGGTWAYWHLDGRQWTAGTWTAGVWTAANLDARQSQHLERLRHRPRLHLERRPSADRTTTTPMSRPPDPARTAHAVPGRAIQLLPASGDGARTTTGRR